MARVNPWRRIERMGAFAIAFGIAFVGILYMVAADLLPVHPPRAVASDGRPPALPPPPEGLVASRVHDIFGDRVPYPTVRFGDRGVTGDASGYYALSDVAVGTYEVEVDAGGFEPRAFRYSVYEGENSPRIKYTTGLWPQEFALDFHVFYAGENSDKLYGIVGVANPFAKPVYIHTLKVEEVGGKVIQDFVADVDTLQNFVLTYPSIQLALEPVPAAVISPRSSLGQIELTPFAAANSSSGKYRLVVTFTVGKNDSGKEERAVKAAVTEREDDYNPHSP